ncbi:hypothetical protein, partial [Glutamicibacter ardleyensis]|uniref:hypothetical protein n=1 Tax=Glutamicibacter ardleyensis TaxID=225894 RepID=UPI003FD62DEC
VKFCLSGIWAAPLAVLDMAGGVHDEGIKVQWFSHGGSPGLLAVAVSSLYPMLSAFAWAVEHYE